MKKGLIWIQNYCMYAPVHNTGTYTREEHVVLSIMI